MKFKSLLLQLHACRNDKSKQQGQLIVSILSKLGPEYVVFVSTFHIVRLAAGEKWKMPKFDAFIESLIHEQDKIIKMGSLKSPNAHALAMHEKGKSKMKPNQQYKGKGKAKDPYPRKGGNPKPPDDSSGSKGKKGKKGNSKCPYCNKGYHPESSCM